MGRVAFVGAGPGPVDLVTLRGARLLARADVVLVDALVDPAFRDLAPRALWIDVGKRGFRCSTQQDVINAQLVRHGREHGLVVRLKGGDPGIFGRLDEELAAVAAAGLECEVVPGITAALAAAADTRRPLTRRGQARSVSLSTAMTRDGTLRSGHAAETEVFYMAGRQLAALSRRLLAARWPASTPVSVVSRAGCPDTLSSTHSIDTLAQASMLHGGRPTVVVIGAGAQPIAGAARTDAAAHGAHLLLAAHHADLVDHRFVVCIAQVAEGWFVGGLLLCASLVVSLGSSHG